MSRAIDLYQQKMWMRVRHPHFSCRVSRRNRTPRLVCRGVVQPIPLSDEYRVRIEYECGIKPKVWVENPNLQRRDPRERIPHTYEGDRPCLFKDDWNTSMPIATSIVPWLMLWLVFYESWRVTGEWQGGGIHPEPAGEQNG